jgi:hypothetical protein
VGPSATKHCNQSIIAGSGSGQIVPSKVNSNYLTIDVSGSNPIGGIAAANSSAAAALSITSGQGGQTNREAMLASRIPRQKVLNIKVKEN